MAAYDENIAEHSVGAVRFPMFPTVFRLFCDGSRVYFDLCTNGDIKRNENAGQAGESPNKRRGRRFENCTANCNIYANLFWNFLLKLQR